MWYVYGIIVTLFSCAIFRTLHIGAANGELGRYGSEIRHLDEQEELEYLFDPWSISDVIECVCWSLIWPVCVLGIVIYTIYLYQKYR